MPSIKGKRKISVSLSDNFLTDITFEGRDFCQNGHSFVPYFCNDQWLLGPNFPTYPGQTRQGEVQVEVGLDCQFLCVSQMGMHLFICNNSPYYS